jgi:hypothetical protein
MLMLDVRNAISRILDRFTLGDIVEITLRKMRRNKFPLPFAIQEFGFQTLAAELNPDPIGSSVLKKRRPRS